MSSASHSRSPSCCAGLLLLSALTLPVRAADFDIEPKRPLTPAQELHVMQDVQSIRVSGETFAYTLSKHNGLIASVKVLGREMAGGTPIPDLLVAEHLDPDFSPYVARNERHARLALIFGRHFKCRDRSGRRVYGAGRTVFPPALFPEIRTLDRRGHPCQRQKLCNRSLHDSLAYCFRAGAVPEEAAKFLNWMPDQSASQSTLYRFRALRSDDSGTLLSGVWIPWIWIGDQNAGLELTTWDVNSQTYNQVDSTARDDEPAMFEVRRRNRQVRWQNYLIRRTRIDGKQRMEQAGSLRPGGHPLEEVRPILQPDQGAHLGPHQHVTRLKLPAEPEIRTLAQNGYNLVVGMANWRSGEYVPLNENELQRTIALCHRYGSKSSPTSRSSISPTLRRNSDSMARSGPSSRPRSSFTTSGQGT